MASPEWEELGSFSMRVRFPMLRNTAASRIRANIFRDSLGKDQREKVQPQQRLQWQYPPIGYAAPRVRRTLSQHPHSKANGLLKSTIWVGPNLGSIGTITFSRDRLKKGFTVLEYSTVSTPRISGHAYTEVEYPPAIGSAKNLRSVGLNHKQFESCQQIKPSNREHQEDGIFIFPYGCAVSIDPKLKIQF